MSNSESPRRNAGRAWRATCILATWAVAGSAAAQGYALDAPARAHIRQAIAVGWTGPQAKGGLIEIRPATGGRAATYAYTHNNPQSVTAPEAPGDYEIVYVFEGEVRASRPLSVFLPEAGLAAPAGQYVVRRGESDGTPATVPAGGTVRVKLE